MTLILDHMTLVLKHMLDISKIYPLTTVMFLGKSFQELCPELTEHRQKSTEDI